MQTNDARWLGWLCLGMGLVGCKSPPTEDRAPAPIAAATTAAPLAATSAPPPRPSASASAPASASSAPAFEASPEPELAEWGKAREIPVKGSGALHCEAKMVREWLRVMCVDRDSSTPTGITINRGRAPGQRSRGENLKAVNNITTLVQAIVPGTDFEATFTWLTQEHVLTVTWPAGAPVSARVIAFDASPEAEAAPEGEPTPVREPTADEWASAKEATVTGSSALGCETKMVRETLRVLCNQKGALDQINVTKESSRGLSSLDKTSKGLALFVRVTEGAHLEASFTFVDQTTRRLVVDWPAGQAMPSQIGKFVAP